jgi:hypothetical protein
MNLQNIITKANEIIKNANFNQLKNVRKNRGPIFLIVALQDGSAIFGSYTSETYYVSIDNQRHNNFLTHRLQKLIESR